VSGDLAHSGGHAGGHEMQPERVARLVNDIAVQFPHLSDDEAAAAIAVHIKKFWDPRMLAELTALAGRTDAGLVARGAAAARLVAEPALRPTPGGPPTGG
jgi:formate dehydrogenase subunit delta